MSTDTTGAGSNLTFTEAASGRFIPFNGPAITPISPLEAEVIDLRKRITQLEAAVVALATGGAVGIQSGGMVVHRQGPLEQI